MITKVKGWFSKPGKGFAQVPQKNFDGTPKLDDKKEPVIGNEQFECEQLSNDSIDSKDPEKFLEDVLESTGANLELAARMFREGWNRVTRIDTAGGDPYQKAAKKLIAFNLPAYEGLTVDQIAEKLKAQS